MYGKPCKVDLWCFCASEDIIPHAIWPVSAKFEEKTCLNTNWSESIRPNHFFFFYDDSYLQIIERISPKASAENLSADSAQWYIF